jgi:4-amino-4-deoxy-L-arabinose transferase-like glycosyltransferase
MERRSDSRLELGSVRNFWQDWQMENRPQWKERVLLLVLALAVAFPFLGSFGLLEPDEGRFAQIGREMAASGDFLIPRLNGIEQFYKPPLVYWISAVGMRLFGISEWTARLPSALAFVGIIWLVGWMGWRVGGRKVGWMAALILASMVEPYALGRQITLDMSLTFWVTAAMACLVEVGLGGRGRGWGYLFFFCMGMGFLAKGPMAWVVPLSAAWMWGWSARRSGGKLTLPWKSGMGLTFGVALSWFVLVCLKYPELWKYFLGYELVERFASTTHGRSKPWWFFLPILAIGTVPWTGFLLGLVNATWKKIKENSLTSVQWALGGAIVIPFVVVSCSGSKLLTYILPIYPALALALAMGLKRGLGGVWEKLGWGMALTLLGLVGPGLWAVRYFWSEAEVAVPSGMYLGGVTGLAVLLIFAWWIKVREGDGLLKVGWVAGVALLFWHGASGEMERINDLLGRQASVRSLARLVEKRMPARLFIYRARASGFIFRLDRNVWINRRDADVVVESSEEAKGRLFEKQDELRRGLGMLRRVFSKHMTYLLFLIMRGLMLGYIRILRPTA